MPRWMRVARGMIGTGVVFSAGMGTASAVVGAVLSVFADFRLVDVIVPAARFAVLGFPIGVAFSGLLALLSRGRTLGSLSVARFTAIGAGVGMLALLLLGISGSAVWSAGDWVLGAVLLPGVGAAIAAASLLLARQGREPRAADGDFASLDVADDATPALGAGAATFTRSPVRERVRDSLQ